MAVKAAAEPQIVMALTSFVGGAALTVIEGDLFAADDPIVKKHPKLFGPVALRRSVPEQRVEQATAGPGEKRGAR
jgi:hypothetical protein